MILYLFILESIGTSELLMIGLIALIIFGPRKLPEMIRMIGKTMAEFRRSTDEFKRTWQKEVDFEDSDYKSSGNSELLLGKHSRIENSIGRVSNLEDNKIIAPEIKEVNGSDFPPNIPEIKSPSIDEAKMEINTADKRNWL
jgi:Tat protein translocase TatB subunit